MKRLASFIILIGLVSTVWGFDRIQNGIITSSGTTVVPLQFRTSELFFQRISTGTAYINITSSMVTTSDRYLRPGVMLSDTVDVNTTKFSFFTSDLPTFLVWEARGWRQAQP